MEYIKINGCKPLSGRVKIAGAKNAALPIMMASILGSETIILQNIPILSDISNTINLLQDLGYDIDVSNDDCDACTQIVKIIPKDNTKYEISYQTASSMRASIWTLGPLLATRKKAIIPLPGGCRLGDRKIDMHVEALQQMGAKIEIKDNVIFGEIDSRLNAVQYHFQKISVGATANILMASSLAIGTTYLSNCAIEPEITDLANFLNSMGAKISGIGTPNLTIEGVERLYKTEYRIIPDRLEAATYAIAASITFGNIIIDNIDPTIMSNILDYLVKIGMKIEVNDKSIKISSSPTFQAVDISTDPYPGFPTDMQAQFCSLLSLSKGVSVIKENIFENRFMHVKELVKMGAQIEMINNHKWIITGVDTLAGAQLFASELRGAASLVIAALGAHGTSTIHNLEYLDRGYAALEKKLSDLGADIIRIKS